MAQDQTKKKDNPGQWMINAFKKSLNCDNNRQQPLHKLKPNPVKSQVPPRVLSIQISEGTAISNGSFRYKSDTV